MGSHDVFISYSTEDKKVADAACNVLERNGVRCWIAPRDVTPGVSYAKSIVDAITGAQIMVLVFSGQTNRSKDVEREIYGAVKRGLTIIPIRIEDVDPEDSLEYFISSAHWLDALTPPLEQHLEQLADAVRNLLATRQGRSSAHPARSSRQTSTETKTTETSETSETSETAETPTGLEESLRRLLAPSESPPSEIFLDGAAEPTEDAGLEESLRRLLAGGDSRSSESPSDNSAPSVTGTVWGFTGTKTTVEFLPEGHTAFADEHGPSTGNWTQRGASLVFDCNGYTEYNVQIDGDQMRGTWRRLRGEDTGFTSGTSLKRIS